MFLYFQKKIIAASFFMCKYAHYHIAADFQLIGMDN